MTARPGLVLLSLAVAAHFATGCAEEFYFSGYVYDGVTGARLTNYQIALESFDTTIDGEVSSEGRYAVGPMSSRADATIRITAPGYRSFMSHNKPPDAFSAAYHVDAYLFPVDMKVPKVRFDIYSSVRPDLPSGIIRLRPASHSAVFQSERPGGVENRTWENDDDLQFSTVTKRFTDGVAEFDEGTFIYGVNYQVDIFGVAGLMPTQGSFFAGIDGDKAFVLNRTENSQLSVAFVNILPGQPIPSGELDIVFTEPIEFDPLGDPGLMRKAVDDSLFIDSPDANGNGQTNGLQPAVPGKEATRGTTVVIEKNVMRITWNPQKALETKDANDPILSVTYGGLDQLHIRPISPTSLARDVVPVSNLVGTGAISVRMVP